MHMADALVSPQVGGLMWAAAIGIEAYSIKKLNREDVFENKKIPVMGMTGAFVFAAQMINFSIPATGSSGHLSGGLLLAALLGPAAGFVVLSTVLLIQALFFADGGLLALGCNIFNMGFFACFIAYPFIVRPLLAKSKSRKNIFAASIAGAVAGLLPGALCVVLETTASGITELPPVAFASLMLPIHLAIGVAEGVATALVLIFINNLEPSLLENKAPVKEGYKKSVAALALAAVLLAGCVSWFASSKPDGLEWSIEHTVPAEAETLESYGAVRESLASIQEHSSVFPDYGPRNAAETDSVIDAGGSLAGLAGSAMVLTAVAALGFIVAARRKKRC